MKKILLYFAIKHSGVWDSIYKSLEKKEKISISDVEGLTPEVQTAAVTILDANYPIWLKEIPKPPFVFFHSGCIDFLKSYKRSLGILINQNPSKYQIKVMKNYLNYFAKEKIVVIFMITEGLNENFAKILKYDIKTIFVINSPLREFIEENSEVIKKYEKNNNILIIAENYYKKLLDPEFKYQSRLFSGITRQTLVIGGSRTLSFKTTIESLIDSGKEIYAIPEEIYSNNFSNNLIKNGAILIETPNEILNYF
ncbi:DNA processing/uptake protein [Spiroplasma sabaudiense Ar-1343]|uniref:DNA processing/uptake protein n=1 Tax=Spiroplasma sabaudiense Ar-1343 TaxID=1276257 RepID=W6A9K3_9MOLU|nr:DNA-processing protein DprA [Spiroplasma sabaudiense]AHI53687.1 DNA processing/uptake protein [Spiroplasma sabaudiense Ar-1343]